MSERIFVSRRIPEAGLRVLRESGAEVTVGQSDTERGIVLLPHIGSASTETRGRMAAMAAHDALAYLRGERMPNPVDPEVYHGEPFRSRRGTS